MDNNKFQNQNDNKQYLSMVNYLISQLNKAKISNFPVKNQSNALPIFLYEFFVFELYLPRELLKLIRQPILAFRLLDFPSLTLEGNLNIRRQSIIFNQGKSSFFEMNLSELKENLVNQPMYVMFLDLNHGNIKVIGNCRLNISLFAYDSFLNYGKGPIPEPRRNILQLFDNTMEKIGEFEMSLIIRREYYKFDKNIEVTENKKTYLIKKAKKSKQILTKDRSENLMFIGKEKPKEPKEIFYDNNKISNSKYMKPQFINNIMIEKNDNAFNAHPINKEIIIKPYNKEEKKSPEKIEEDKKNKKGKVMKCNAQTETDLIPGVDVPINKVDYHKKNVKKKKVKKDYNFNKMNYHQNNQMLINSMYSKYPSDSHYIFPEYELRPINNNNNYFNNYFNNQNNNNNNFGGNGGIQNNTYLNFLTNLKSQVNDYTNNLINDKKLLQKIKDERNLNLPNKLENQESNNINIQDDINKNENQFNNQIKDIKKSESIKSFENKEIDKDNNINENINNNIINNDNNNINENDRKDMKKLEESKDDEGYDDFEDSDKLNKSINQKKNNEILENKFNNFNTDFDIKNEDNIPENINNIDTNSNKINNNVNLASETEIKEDSSLKKNNQNNRIDSGEIGEEIDENLISTKKQIKTSKNGEINSGSEFKGLASSSTEKIENLLK